jgi:hypothetical protein
MFFGQGRCVRTWFVLSSLVTTVWAGPVTAAQTTVSWTDNSPNEEGFKVERKTGTTGVYAEIASIGPNARSYVDTRVVTGATYCYRSRAFQATTYSPYSNEDCKTIPPSSADIPQTKWQVKFVDSQETNYGAVKAFDGSSTTFWHTKWVNGSPLPPHEIQINLGGTYTLSGFRYLPRQDGQTNGRVGKYEFYVSLDGVTWGAPVASGSFANDATQKTVLFATKMGKFVRFRALSEVNGKPWTSVAELKVLGSLPPTVSASLASPSALLTAPLPISSPQQPTVGTKKESAKRTSAALAQLAVKIGVFRPRTGTLYIDQNGDGLWDGCSADRCVKLFDPAPTPPAVAAWSALGLPPLPLLFPAADSFARPQEILLKGDWSGAGHSSAGAFTPATGLWRLDLNGDGAWNGCKVDGCVGPFGQAGDLPVVGDWVGDGASMIGVFDPHTGLWELDLNKNGAWDGCAVDLCLGPFGEPGDLPVISQ